MKKILLTLTILFGIIVHTGAELSQSELNKLTSQQRQIYLNQLKELNQKLKQLDRDIFKAEDMIKIGQEMQREPDGSAKQSGAVYIMRGMELKEKATREIRETQNALVLLDRAVREAIINNERNKKK